MSDVFMSYSRVDTGRALALAESLSQQGWSVWWDRNIPPGKKFDEVIELALSSAKCVVVLWSKDSVGSDWVKTEAAEAAKRKILIPVLIDNVAIPLEFRRIQAANLSDWNGDPRHPGFQDLLRAISSIASPTNPGDLEPSRHTDVAPLEIEGRRPAVSETAWSAQLLQKSWWSRKLRITRGARSHVIEYHVGWTPRVLLDGKIVSTEYTGIWNTKYTFAIHDDQSKYRCLITVKQNVSTLTIASFQLIIDNYLVYSGDS
jgi:TIR domain